MKLSLILMALLGGLFLGQGCALAQGELRPELEKAFDAYQSAVVARDAEKFRGSLASFRYVKMRNKAVSQGEKFPEPFFEEVNRYSLIDLKKLNHVETVQSGDAAYMIYFSKEARDPSNKGSKLEPVLTSLLFVKEVGKWKFAEGERAGLPEGEAGVAPAELAKKYPPRFQESEGALSGKVPPVPHEYPPPDYLGGISVSAENCKVTVKYNLESETVEHSSMSGPMVGGLKRGKNGISINIEPSSEKNADAQESTTAPHVEVEVWVYAARSEPLAKVFYFETDSLGEVKKEFEVTDETIRKGKQ